MPGQVGIVGAGTMGLGIAEVSLVAGHAVRLFDADPAAAGSARDRLAASLERSMAHGRLDAAGRDLALAGLVVADDLPEVAAGSSLVIESVAEDLAVKQAVFRALDDAAAADVVLATNTSSLSVAACAEATRRPERVVGLHFFNPAPRMALVEVAATQATAQLTSQLAVDFAQALGKTPVRCADVPGFIVNRVGRAYLLEAVRLLGAGAGDVAGIDRAMEAAGYPMGPFRLLDLIGLDVDLAIDDRLFEAFEGAARFAAPDLQRTLVSEGRLGRKAGRGFYRTTADGTAIVDVDPMIAGRHVADAAIVERLELAVINEAYRAVEDGVAAPPDVDLAMRLGAGHPAGPFEHAGQLGLRDVVTRLHALHVAGQAASDAATAEQYAVAISLWQVATV